MKINTRTRGELNIQQLHLALYIILQTLGELTHTHKSSWCTKHSFNSFNSKTVCARFFALLRVALVVVGWAISESWFVVVGAAALGCRCTPFPYKKTRDFLLLSEPRNNCRGLRRLHADNNYAQTNRPIVTLWGTRWWFDCEILVYQEPKKKLLALPSLCQGSEIVFDFVYVLRRMATNNDLALCVSL